jgi:hypothetical protein
MGHALLARQGGQREGRQGCVGAACR